MLSFSFPDDYNMTKLARARKAEKGLYQVNSLQFYDIQVSLF